MWQRGHRQAAALEEIVQATRSLADATALLLVGSGAKDEVDDLSDLDLLLVTAPNRFESVWATRHEVSATAVWSDDSPESRQGGPGVHTWLTRELVFVELLIGEPGQFRVADPAPTALGGRVGARATSSAWTLDRALEFDPDPLEVARAYDDLKEAVRRARRGAMVSSPRAAPRRRRGATRNDAPRS